MKDSIILELLASWKYEKQPVMMTTAVSTIPRYNWRKTQRHCSAYVHVGCAEVLKSLGQSVIYVGNLESDVLKDVLMRCRWGPDANECVCVCVRVCARATHIVSCRFILSGRLDSVSQEAEDGADPEQDGEPPEQLATELDPLWSCGRRGEGVGTIPDQKLSCLGIGQALQEAQQEEE